jgi:hypothetical protein
MISRFASWRSAILLGFRASAIGQMIALFGQALLAGSALSGNSASLTAHMMIGGLALVFSIAQGIFGLFLRNELPEWVLAASAGLLLGEIAQMASGRRHLFAIHLPLGLALFATLVPLVLWIANDTWFHPQHERGARRSAVKWSFGGE